MEYFGGFRSLEYDGLDEFPSSLSANGTVKWTELHSSTSPEPFESVSAEISVTFPATSWSSLQSVYGWAALQYQAWIRGTLTLKDRHSRHVSLIVANVLEFWVDDQQIFGGDFYSYGKAPSVLLLRPGKHRLDIRVIRDVRAMGGIGDPDVPIQIKVSVPSIDLYVDLKHILLPEFINGHSFSSSIGSIPVQNFGENWIDVVALESVSVGCSAIKLRTISNHL